MNTSAIMDKYYDVELKSPDLDRFEKNAIKIRFQALYERLKAAAEHLCDSSELKMCSWNSAITVGAYTFTPNCIEKFEEYVAERETQVKNLLFINALNEYFCTEHEGWGKLPISNQESVEIGNNWHNLSDSETYNKLVTHLQIIQNLDYLEGINRRLKAIDQEPLQIENGDYINCIPTTEYVIIPSSSRVSIIDHQYIIDEYVQELEEPHTRCDSETLNRIPAYLNEIGMSDFIEEMNERLRDIGEKALEWRKPVGEKKVPACVYVNERFCYVDNAYDRDRIEEYISNLERRHY